jgi:hypothetical protein
MRPAVRHARAACTLAAPTPRAIAPHLRHAPETSDGYRFGLRFSCTFALADAARVRASLVGLAEKQRTCSETARFALGGMVRGLSAGQRTWRMGRRRRACRATGVSRRHPEQGKRQEQFVKKIYVGNLPWSATESELRDFFSPYGDVVSVSIVMDRETGRSRGFAFVEMPDADALSAIAETNGKSMNGRPLRINEAQERARPPRPPRRP